MSTTTFQPPPALLNSVSDTDSLGMLTLLLGYAPGVGKSTRLIMAGEHRRTLGSHVVIGCMPEYTPPNSAMRTTLQSVPMQEMTFRNHSLVRMDVEAILTRRPNVVLVDDVANLNPPDQGHKYRWQDVEELLAAGIHVVGTLDIFHLPPGARLLEQRIGVPVRESVSKTFLRRARDISLVDRGVEELEKDYRLGIIPSHGVPSWARERFYQPALLDGLRRAALLEVANFLKRDVTPPSFSTRCETPMDARGRVMVLLDSTAAASVHLLRKGAELAHFYDVHWFVVFLEPESGHLTRSSGESWRAMPKILEWAQDLDAEIVHLRSGNPQLALEQFARSHGVGHLVTHHRRTEKWRRWFAATPLQHLLDWADDMEIHIIAPHEGYTP